MSQRPPDADLPFDDEEEEESTAAYSTAVIDAYSAFRLLVILVAIWSFVEGFALFTGGIEALSLDADRTAERIIGAQMIVLTPVFGLLAWRRDQFRLLLWLPYAAQLAIIVPIALSILSGDGDGILLFVVSLFFFVLLFYFWWHSHPLEHFAEEFDEDDEDEDAEDEERSGRPPGTGRASSLERRLPPAGVRDGGRRPGRFRRRDP
jgi:hypothetical protein